MTRLTPGLENVLERRGSKIKYFPKVSKVENNGYNSSWEEVGREGCNCDGYAPLFIHNHMEYQELNGTAGAWSGYGAGIAKAFAAQGAKVMIADINQPVEGVLKQASDSLKFHKTDVSK